MSKQSIIYLINVFSIQYLWAQTDIQNDFSTENIENQLIGRVETPFEYDAEYEYLNHFKQHPIELNRATQDDLKALRLLSDFEINDFLNYRQKNGSLLTLYELQSLWKSDIINKLLPFVTVDAAKDAPTLSFAERLQRGSHQIYVRVARRVEPSVGFLKSETNGGYQGNSNSTYTRYGYRFSNDISYGCTLEKDAGETSFSDFKSLHFQLKYPISRVKKLYLGDFSARLGQGLIHNNGFTIGKSAAALTLENTAPVLQAYRSVNENDFLRGAAATITLGEKTVIHFFSSYRRFDGTLKQMKINALSFTGLHRTESEINRRNAVGIWTNGGRWEKQFQQIKIGANIITHQFQYPLNPRATEQTPFPFKGSFLMNMSMDYNAMMGNKHLFGEMALSKNGAIATSNSISFSIGKPLTIILLHRFFDAKYHAFAATSFGENSRVKDENGLYIGFQYVPQKRWTLTGYADIWRTSIRTGNELLFNAAFQQKKTSFLFQIKHKSLFQPEEDTTFFTKRQHLRIQIQYPLARHWKGANRAEWVQTRAKSGFMLYQDLFWKPKNLRFHANTRFTYFDTDNFESVIYAYENDLMSNYTISRLYFKGGRFYVNLGYEPNSKWLLEARFARTIWQNQRSIGSGLDKTVGNRRTDCKIQMRFRF